MGTESTGGMRKRLRMLAALFISRMEHQSHQETSETLVPGDKFSENTWSHMYISIHRKTYTN